MTGDVLKRADAWLSEFHNKGGVTVPDDSYLAVIRDLAAALRKERAIAEANYKSLSDALHVEQDRTHRYHERAERAEAERNELKRNLDAELEGAMALRERCGARKNESFPAFVERLHRDRDSLRALLREARESWIKVGYGASHEDVAECRDFCSRIDAALGEGK